MKYRSLDLGAAAPPARSTLTLAILLALSMPAAWAQPGAAPASAPLPDTPKLFVQICALCHGNDARGTDRAPSLVNTATLRSLSEADIVAIIQKGKNKMPAFPLTAADLQDLAHFIRNLNTTGPATAVAGDPQAGERYFFGEGRCADCHIAAGRGSSIGPNLSDVGLRACGPRICSRGADRSRRPPVGRTAMPSSQ